MHRSPVRLLTLAGMVSVAVAGCTGDDSGSGPTESTVASVTTGEPVDSTPPLTTVVRSDGAVLFQVESRDHTDEDVEYPQSPPVGGDHAPVWQNCGVYTTPIREVHAVHSLEHGAVWITYQPDLDPTVVARLEAFATNQTHVLVSPYADQSTPIVLTAWSVQQTFAEFDEAAIGSFLRTYQQGPLTPEPGAVCSGGTSEPA